MYRKFDCMKFSTGPVMVQIYDVPDITTALGGQLARVKMLKIKLKPLD